MFICSVDGPKSVPIDTGDKPSKPDPAGGGMGKCPLCPLVGGMALPPPETLPPLPGYFIAHDRKVLPGARVAAGWYLFSLKARGPPALG